MLQDLWFPRRYKLSSTIELGKMLYCGEEWQIYGSKLQLKYLIIKPNLGDKWIDSHLIDQSLLKPILYGAEKYYILICNSDFRLEPVENSNSPSDKSDALAFAIALKESRKVLSDVSFHDSIYLEQYTRLLPTWTLSASISDDYVFGSWLTGGVYISVNSFRRLTNLLGWMSRNDLFEVIQISGLNSNTQTAISTDNQKTVINKSLQIGEDVDNKDDKKGTYFSLPGRPMLEEFFNDHVIDIILNEDKYATLGINFPSAIVLHGPPGCGKTYAVERLIEFIDWPSFAISSNSVGSPYIHETSKKISEVFNNAIDSAPSVIIIDEMESFLSDRRGDTNSSTHHIEEVAEFLRRIPEAINNKVLIIAMTNMIDVIDPAILRRGRFDHIIKVDMPSREEVDSLLRELLSKVPVSPNIEKEFLLELLVGKPLSDIAYVIREAARIAAKMNKICIDQESLVKSMDSIPKDHAVSKKRIGF
ncbi:MAG: ATP-binding protein [Candidatus Cloacimonadaceae bacterium]|nr:ATP-binding protein [Candidatus Cloacimonadaceae bacterium]